MRFDCVWRRPAVSTMQTSAPASTARATALWAMLAGSLPCGPRTISAPSRSAHIVSCSTAAARKVSPAPRTTRFPSRVNIRASFAIDVVFPDPLTPVTRITVGPDTAMVSPASVFRRRARSWVRIESRTTSGSTTRARSRSRTSSTIASAAAGPMSVRTRIPRSSSRKSSSTSLPSRLKRSRTSVRSTWAVFASPALRRSRSPRGFSAPSAEPAGVDAAGVSFGGWSLLGWSFGSLRPKLKMPIDRLPGRRWWGGSTAAD